MHRITPVDNGVSMLEHKKAPAGEESAFLKMRCKNLSLQLNLPYSTHASSAVQYRTHVSSGKSDLRTSP